MLNWMSYGIIIGSCTSSFSALLVLIELCCLKYKDLSNTMIFFLMIIDLFISFTRLAIMYPISSLWCACSQTTWVVFRQWHKYLVFFIAYSMHCIIVKEKNISLRCLKYYLAFTLLLSLSAGILNYMFIKVEIESICVLLLDVNASIYYLIFALEYTPDFFILIFLCFYYGRIKNVLKKEIMVCNLKSARKRFFAKRLFGYCFMFCLYIFPYFIIEMVNDYEHDRNAGSLEETLSMIYSWYPFMDALVYGFTKSFKKNILNLIWKSPKFDTTQETLQVLREGQILRPRYYLDLAEISEPSSIFK
ncbi:hypothetical protein SteCoe_35011 [Stentor coeruleus]|uniref:G-protein coupled receptors family 1 profile domain-containing protein n=1 Tax=Stentor coeruleus TaxID=5963 RepID=A0A1R2ATA4_9CILI|nr:hypothetical protein SteCoe_35011 [Stentor coeruleus]